VVENELKHITAEVLNSFDFAMVSELMKTTKHKWSTVDCPEMEVPSIERMKQNVAELIKDLLVEHKGKGSMGCGGFIVSVNPFGKLVVIFRTEITHAYEFGP
jgi:hypothetical protein